MKSLSLCILLLILGSAGCQPQPGEEVQDKLAQVDELFADWEGEGPGGAVAVIRDGAVIYERYFGLANLEKNEPYSRYSVTDIGSISKQFTTLSVALLEEEGALHVDDDIRNYIPELPDYGSEIRIKNLIFHTSGIKDHEELVKLKGMEAYGEHMSNPSAVQLITRQQTLNFEPGMEYEYSNANYVLLAEIVERVSGMPFDAFTKKHIFEPLHMDDSFFNLNQGEDFENRAWGYFSSAEGYRRPIYESHIIGDGGLFTTLPDFIKWDANFTKNQLGKGDAALIQRMKYREPLSSGTPNFMAFAQIETIHPFGKTSWSHGGSGGGYRSFYIRFEDPSFSVIVFGNADDNNSFEKANAVVNLFLDDSPVQAPDRMNPSESPVVAPSATLTLDEIQQFEGYYLNRDSRQVVRVTFNEQEQVFYINWYDGGSPGYRAVAKDAETLVETEDAQQTYVLNLIEQTLTNRIGDRVGMVLEKLESFNRDLADYEGRYYSEELDYAFEILMEESALTSDNDYLKAIVPMSPLVFFDTESKVIMSFSRDVTGKARTLELDIPLGDRTLRGMRFYNNAPMVPESNF